MVAVFRVDQNWRHTDGGTGVITALDHATETCRMTMTLSDGRVQEMTWTFTELWNSTGWSAVD